MAGKSLNKVQLIGHLGKDPDLRYTATGTAVANFSLATNERFKPADKEEWQERTEWHRIVAWGRLAEIAGEYLAKGRQVYIEGRLQTREWEDKEKIKRYSTEIVAGDIILLGGKGEGGGGNRPPHPAESYAPTGVSQADEVAESRMPQETPPPDDIPF